MTWLSRISLQAAHAAVAEDAGVVIDGDDQRGIVLGLLTIRLGEARVFDAIVPGKREQFVGLIGFRFATAGGRLGGLIGHQQLGEHLDAGADALAGGGGLDLEASDTGK